MVGGCSDFVTQAPWVSQCAETQRTAAGFGSRAAYRGDKLTRRVWDGIVAGGFVAQALALPSERRLSIDGAESELKLDLRAYAYAGRIHFTTARLYRGQTTNFRTPGGGFAPVFLIREAHGHERYHHVPQARMRQGSGRPREGDLS